MNSLLTCPICQHLFQNPVTTPCGHSFCQQCLNRALQQATFSASCPLCRRPLHGVGHVNVTLCDLVDALSEELNDLPLKPSRTPRLEELVSPRLGVFVLSGVLLVPGRTVMLNVFERRYLELMRRCLESGDVFGMQRSPDSSKGCTLRIRACRNRGPTTLRTMLVEAVVESRYSTGGRNLVVDSEGVYVANDVEIIKDFDSEEDFSELAERLFGGISDAISGLSSPEKRAFMERCASGFGDSIPPSDPVKLCWFVLSTVDTFSVSRQDLVYETSMEARLKACIKALEDKRFGSDPKARLELFTSGIQGSVGWLAANLRGIVVLGLAAALVVYNR